MKFETEIISVTEAAKRCKVTRATIWRWIKSGLLKAGVTAGGHYRITHEDLQNLIRSKKMTSHRRTNIDTHKILVVDDDPLVRKLLGKVLTREGYDVAFASDGFEAGVKTIKIQPHIVILDLFMPKMNGFEVCRQIKKDSDTATIKIIAISGDDGSKTREMILSCGADRFLSKPLDMKIMISEIRQLIRSKEM